MCCPEIISSGDIYKQKQFAAPKKKIAALVQGRGRQGHLIWAKSASPSTKMLQLVKIDILDPSVGVRNYWVQFCPSRFRKFRHLSSHFWRNKNELLIFGGVLDPSNLRFSSSENFKFEGSRTPPKINILFWFLQKWLLKCLNFPNLEGQNWTQ